MVQILKSQNTQCYLITTKIQCSFKELKTIKDNARLKTPPSTGQSGQNIPVWVAVCQKNKTVTQVVFETPLPQVYNNQVWLTKIGFLEDFINNEGTSFEMYYIKFKNHQPIAIHILEKEFYLEKSFCLTTQGEPITILSVAIK